MIKAPQDIHPTTKYQQEIRPSLPSVMQLKGFKTKY